MLTDIEEEQKKNVTKTRKHRSISKQHKLNRSPSAKISEIPQKRHRSLTKKRTDSSKLTKEEIKYQRFVNGLKKEIKIYLNQCLRESRFDSRGNQCLQLNPSLMNKRSTSTLSSHRINQINPVVNNRQRSIKFLKNNETKRLTADVQAIITGPALKSFYTQFIQSRQQQQQQSSPTIHLRPLEESILWSNEQE